MPKIGNCPYYYFIYSVIVRGEGSYMTYVHGTHNMSRGTISAVNIHFEP